MDNLNTAIKEAFFHLGLSIELQYFQQKVSFTTLHEWKWLFFVQQEMVLENQWLLYQHCSITYIWWQNTIKSKSYYRFGYSHNHASPTFYESLYKHKFTSQQRGGKFPPSVVSLNLAAQIVVMVTALMRHIWCDLSMDDELSQLVYLCSGHSIIV